MPRTRKEPNYICHDCGIKFCNGFTNTDKKYATFHIGTCECCGATDVPCTEPRDYNYFKQWPLDPSEDPKPCPQNHMDLIEHVLNNFDFEKVHKTMTVLDWKWYRINQPIAVPTIEQIKESAKRRLLDVVLHKHTVCGSGGIFAEKYDDGLKLWFELTGSEAYFEDFT